MFTIPSFILLIHIGCFSCSENRLLRPGHFRRSHSNSVLKNKTNNVRSFLKRLFSSAAANPAGQRSPPAFTIPVNSPPLNNDDIPDYKHHALSPCTACGEIFENPNLLERHVSLIHGVSTLIDGENILRIIFEAGWPEKARSPNIRRILKIHHGANTVARFEEHREQVKSRSAASGKPRHERCAADGNEMLRFCCTTLACGLQSGICAHQYCGACRIVRSGFSRKADGISTFPTSWRAHDAVPEEEFEFMNVKRAMLVCRVITGRVGCYPGHVEQEDPGFDSLVGEGSGFGFEDELIVVDPTAVLPCFLIVYAL